MWVARVRLLVVLMLVLSAWVAPADALDRDWAPDQATSVVQEAQELYGPDVTVYNATDPLFTEVFPNHALKVVHSTTPHGVSLRHLMAFRANTGYDLTRNFTALMIDQGVLLLSAADAVKLGKIHATMANAEIQFGRNVVYAANSTDLNHTVSDPSASSTIGGWRVTLSTWGAAYGAVMNWTIDFGTASILSSSGLTVARARGWYDLDLHQVFVPENLSISNAYSTSHAVTFGQNSTTLVAPWDLANLNYTLVATAETFDGSDVQVKYRYVWGDSIPTAAYPEAQLLADSLAWAYNRTVQSSITSPSCASGNQTSLAWKYHVRDSDCVLDLILDDQRILVSPMGFDGTATSINISATFAYRVALARLGYTPDAEACSNECLTRTIMTHELYHGLQKVYFSGVHAWFAVEEGIGRLQETLTTKTYTQVNNSVWYTTLEHSRRAYVNPGNHGLPNWVKDNSQLPFCDLSAFAAGYWGSAYMRAGSKGIDFLNDVQTRTHQNSTKGCMDYLPRIIDDALATVNQNETSFNASLARYAITLYERRFEWGDPHDGNASVNWSTHQKPVPSHNGTTTPAMKVPGYGFQYFSLPANRTYDVKCTSPGSSWDHRMLNRSSSSGWQSATQLTCGTNVRVTGTDWAEVVLVAVRLHKDNEDASLVITEV